MLHYLFVFFSFAASCWMLYGIILLVLNLKAKVMEHIKQEAYKREQAAHEQVIETGKTLYSN
jgi:hypothetical protein